MTRLKPKPLLPVTALEKKAIAVKAYLDKPEPTDREKLFAQKYAEYDGDEMRAYIEAFNPRTNQKLIKASIEKLMARPRVIAEINSVSPTGRRLFAELNKGITAPVKEKHISWADKEKYLRLAMQQKRMIGADTSMNHPTNIAIVVER